MADGMKDNVAVITGGSRGIGRAIALDFAKQGCDSLLIARTESDLADTAAEIGNSTGRRIETAALDLTSLEACESVASIVQDTFGRGLAVWIRSKILGRCPSFSSFVACAR